MADKEKLNIAEAHFENGYKLLMEEKYDEAIEAYKVSIETAPLAKSYTYLAWAYSKQERYEEAVNECYNAILVDPEFSTAYNDIGCYFMKLGRYSEAVDWLEKAIHLEVNETRCHSLCNLALILEKKGEWLKAMYYYNKALLLSPDFEAAQNGILRLTTLLN